MAFLYLIFFFFLFILFAGIGIVRSIFRLLFGSRSSRPYGQQPDNSQHEDDDTYTTGSNKRGWSGSARSKKSKKVFADDEGEYIDFEEIKDK